MNYRRLYQPGAHYFFTVVTEGRQPLLIEHIHFNPVKHGYVTMPLDWPFSSFRQAVAKGWSEPDGLNPVNDFDDKTYE